MMALTGSPKSWSIPKVGISVLGLTQRGAGDEEKPVYRGTDRPRQAEAGTPAVEVCRKLGVSEQTFYRWKRQFAGTRVPEPHRCHEADDHRVRAISTSTMIRSANACIMLISITTTQMLDCGPLPRPG
jgi:Transposase